MEPLRSQRQYEHAQSKLELLDELIAQQTADVDRDIAALQQQIETARASYARTVDALQNARADIADAMQVWKNSQGGEG